MRAGRYVNDCPAFYLAQIDDDCPEFDASGYRLAGYADHYRQQAERVREYRQRAIPSRFRTATTERVLGDVGLYLWGPVGSGKTYEAAALALQAIEVGLKVHWLNASLWLAAIRASFNGGESPATPEQLADTDVLVIDDLGTEKPSEWAIEQLHALVNRAYEQDLLLIVTSNHRLADTEKRLGARVVSRIAEMTDAVEIRGDDRRLAAALKRRSGRGGG